MLNLDSEEGLKDSFQQIMHSVSVFPSIEAEGFASED